MRSKLLSIQWIGCRREDGSINLNDAFKLATPAGHVIAFPEAVTEYLDEVERLAGAGIKDRGIAALALLEAERRGALGAEG